MSAAADRYYSIVLAAGAGSRFGGSKLTAAWEGGVLLQPALRTARAAPVGEVVVVTGAHASAVEDAVRDVAGMAGPPMRVVRCADHASGMAASLRCGLAALPNQAAGAFIFLGDMPRVPATLAARLLDRVHAGAVAAAPVCKGRLGHPVLLSRGLFEAFSQAAGDGGGGRMLRNLGGDLARVETDDEGVLEDVDTPADLDGLGTARREPRP